MPEAGLMTPGVALMRRLTFTGKILVIGFVAILPISVMFWQLLTGHGSTQTFEYGISICAIGTVIFSYLLIAFQQSVTRELRQLTRTVDLMMAGDLRQIELVHSQDELGQVANSICRLARTVSAMVANVRSNAAFVTHSGKSLSHGSRDLSDRTEQQAASLERTAASVEELSATVQENASTASLANGQAGEVRQTADSGGTIMAQAVESVEAIQASAKRMDEIVGVIDGLAFQTNILALNAAVEAARAGESGRGFAVVASEVRSLAKRSAESSREIRQLIGSSSSQVESSVQKIRSAGDAISHVVHGIRDVAASMSQISTSTAEQSSSLSEITSAIRQLDEITQRNSQMVELAVSQAENLERRANTLVESVAMFKLQQGSAEEALALVQRAATYRQCTSKDSFLRDLTDPGKGFYDRDMYVFVLDDKGPYLSFGGNPAKVGTRVQDIPGIDGGGLLRSIVDQADYEPGWVEYDITNPKTGMVQTKMSFVQRVDNFYLGCGVYRNLAAA
jgi:methyl-accepting chemotaxis protein